MSLALALAATARAGQLTVINHTGLNLPELPVQVELALGGLVEQVPAPVVVTLDLVEATNLRDRWTQPFPFGPRTVSPSGFVNDWATVMVQGRVAVLPAGAAKPVERRFIGRCAAWQDYEPHFASVRTRRPFSGWQAYAGRFDANGPLVVGALGNAFARDHLDRWLLQVCGIF